MVSQWVIFGKLVLAVMSFPVWEAGIVSMKVAIEKARSRKEDLPFFPRLVLLLTGFSGLMGACLMCYPIISHLGLIGVK